MVQFITQQLYPSEGGGGEGNVVGPNSSTDGGVVLFDGGTGKIIKDSGTTLTDITDDIGELQLDMPNKSTALHDDGAPDTLPSKSGDIYTDDLTGETYISNGTDSLDNWIKVGAGQVDDVKVDGTSVVTDKVANIYSDEAAEFSSTYGMLHREDASKGDIAKVQQTELKQYEGYGIIDVEGAAKGGMTGLTVYGYFDEVSPLPTGYTQVNKVNGNTTLSTGLSGDLATVTIDGDKGPFKLRADGQLVFNAIPCINDNNVVGFYDLVSKTFKQPAATVTAGTEVTGPTPEVPRVIISNNGPLRYDTQEQEWYTEGPDTVIQISYIG